MIEYVGVCACCGKELFCLNGFFNGILSDEKKIFCVECYNDPHKHETPQS